MQSPLYLMEFFLFAPFKTVALSLLCLTTLFISFTTLITIYNDLVYLLTYLLLVSPIRIYSQQGHEAVYLVHSFI